MSSLFYLLSFQLTQVYLCAPDQAVKTLTETWHPDDIPTVFTASGREALCAQPEPSNSHAGCSASPPLISTGFSALFAGDNAQLPSPVTPTSHQTPLPTGDRCESYSQAPEGSVGSNLIPIKGFVHEVLRRSRTSTGVLQTALCYLEAVRSKVPELLRKEKTRPTSESATFGEPPEPRIVQGVFEDEVFTSASSGTPDKTAGPTLETIRIGDTDMPLRPSDSASRGQDESALPPLPPLPSPLCCPRRTFLACLILASKFIQDRSYSNRAWAKLAGLPPREIGRCERALGEALEWRLWVGKLPASSTATFGAIVGRTVSRTRSEGDVLYGSTRTCTPSSTAAWATTSAAPVSSSSAHTFFSIPPPIPAPRTGMPDRSSILVDPFFVPNSDATGYCYEAREALRSGYDTSSQMDVEPQYEISPSLSTPTLSYSPMSSASSSSDGSEDRTIQMSMFLNLPTPAMSTGNNLGPWVANISSYTPSDPANPCGSFSSIPAYSYVKPANPTYAADMDVTEAAARSTLTTSDLSGVKQVPNTLPSFAEMFSNPGAFDNGTQ
ncbi:hypothetical protein BD309DRAFT_995475 [Dichomitus squalens]|nr:hypothetical protein BD309DRAFT_995475 [Dichomitus squalens]